MRFASVTSRLAGLGADKWALHHEARRRAGAGQSIIELTIGEPDTPPPQAVIDAAIDGLHRRRTKYSGGRGDAGVIEALARKYARRSGRPIGPGNIAYLPGTQTALYAVMRTLAEAGDEVLVGDPLYATYEGVIRASGATPVFVPLDPAHGFHMRAADLEAGITPRSRVLLLNTPHNPTGATLSYEEIGEIAAVCARHDLWIVSDEVYETMAYAGSFASPFDHPLGAERTAVVSSISKSHMLPGLRAGWCAGPVELIDRLLPLSEMMLFGAQPFIMDAAAVAVEGDFAECHAMVETFRRRAKVLPDRLGNTPGLACPMPEGGMFAMVDVSGTGLTGEAFAWRLLEEERVAVMPGSSFGEQAGGHVRVSLSADEAVLHEAAERMVRLAIRLTHGRAA
ncbi:pyridoxal phosphate-dependent aminotransferase [Labrys wisconsinensis]|uniref:aspartate transaminase n=1 Tax=Labrys wisconsinensis TaxID=425677 RepID=A0ABU0IZ73_9HYPH|nr:pyridoxal phosphate-dependent aminotransferase [Labrys wisconsinensis]MDQ0467314.1 arginine:pyruvate transaminase [Labrys wisconsinensis]